MHTMCEPAPNLFHEIITAEHPFIAHGPIDLRCPIGGGIFERGKTGSFSYSGSKLDHQEAFTAYIGSGYASINNKLRGHGNDGHYATDAVLDKHIEDLKKLVAMGESRGGSVVYRGVSGRRVPFEEFRSKIGSKIQIPGFVSTSHSKAFARAWNSALFRIYVPSRARVLDVAARRGFRDGEAEVILPHNSTYTVHNVTREAGGRVVVDLIMQRS